MGVRVPPPAPFRRFKAYTGFLGSFGKIGRGGADLDRTRALLMVATEKSLGYKSINNDGGITGAFQMRKLSAICVAAFVAALVAGTAAEAFEGDAQPGVRVYLAFPFDPDTTEQAAPSIGFRVGLGSDSLPYGAGSRAYGNAQTYNSSQLALPRGEFDFRWRLDGKSGTIFNGLDVEETMNALYAANGEDVMEGIVTPLAVIGGGIAIFAAAKASH